MLETFDWTDGVVLDEPHAIVLPAIEPGWNLVSAFAEKGAVFGFVLEGECARLRRHGVSYPLTTGTYFVTNSGGAALTSPGANILLIMAPGADFPFMIGGPIEPRGRMRYIDGCTDSLLIPPWKKGEPCLNLLHIPQGIEQTMHTHPSDRIGVVVSGHGQCVTPEGVTSLQPGLIWRIPKDAEHRFRTPGDSLQIVAWHETSDWGPTDDSHPMLAQTLVDGISADQIPAIRTGA